MKTSPRKKRVKRWSFDKLTAYQENEVRRNLGAAFDKARLAKGISVYALAKLSGVSKPQVLRALHHQPKLPLTLRTITRVSEILAVNVGMGVFID